MAPETLLAQFSEQHVAAFFLVLARISPLFLLAPLFSSKMINGRVKGIAAVALTVGIMPVAKHGQIDLSVLGYAGLIVKEIIVGLAFAYALHAMFAAIQAAGTLLDTMIGLSFGAMVDPITGTQSAVIQQMYSLFGVMVFVVIGGDAWVIKGFAKTYEAVPLLDAPNITSMVHGAQVAFSSVFISAFMIAAPVIVAMIIVDAAFGVVTRVVPQMNIFAVGFPAKLIVGLSLIGASLPVVGGFVADQLQLSVAQAVAALGG